MGVTVGGWLPEPLMDAGDPHGCGVNSDSAFQVLSGIGGILEFLESVKKADRGRYA